MNRGFKTYYREGMNKSFKIFKKKGNKLKFYLYSFMNLFGRILFFFVQPIFDLSNVRMAKMMKYDEKMDISKSFSTANSIKSLWTAFLSSIIIILMFLGGILLIAFLEVFIFGLCFIIGDLCQNYYLTYDLLLILSIPVAIGLLVYIVMFPLYFAPSIYIADTVKDVGGSVVVSKSLEAMKRNGKGTCIKILLITGLIHVGYLGIAGVVTWALFSAGAAAGLISIICFLVPYIIFVPVINGGANIALVSLFEDLVIDKYNEKQVVKGIYVVNSKTMDTTIDNYQDNLIRLFDDTADVKLSLKEKNVESSDNQIKEKAKIEEFNEDDLLKLMKEHDIPEEFVEEEHIVYEDNKEDLKEEINEESFFKKVKKGAKSIYSKTLTLIDKLKKDKKEDKKENEVQVEESVQDVENLMEEEHIEENIQEEQEVEENSSNVEEQIIEETKDEVSDNVEENNLEGGE